MNVNEISLHLSLVLVLEPLVEGGAVELQRPLEASFALDLHDGVRASDHLDQTHAVPDREAPVRQHPEAQAQTVSPIALGDELREAGMSTCNSIPIPCWKHCT